MNYLPSKLTKLRKHYNLSQSYVADYLDVDVIEYMSYENGGSMINYNQMKKLSTLYHINMTMMFRNSDEVELFDIENQNTDEINAKYFMSEKSFFDAFKEFILNHKIVTSIIFSLLIVVFVLINIINNSKVYEIYKEDINRLSVSDSTVIYIDDNGAVGFSGSNSNGQLNDLATNSAIKVCEGEGFSVVLQEDGTIISSGLLDKYSKELTSWKNIVDIACGNNHVLGLDASGRVHCTGSDEPCEVDGTKNIKKIFATSNASIIMDEVGNINHSGTFIGSSLLKDRYNILDISSSDNILVILNSDNTLDVFDKSGSYLKAEGWSDIVDVCCGDDFVAALDSYGKVHIEINNDEIEEQVNEWSNIIAIGSGKDYLIGFDGKSIYGVGNNSYNQFKKEVKKKITLDKVKNISYVLDEENIYIQFDEAINASGYLVELNVGTGLSKRVEKAEQVSFSTENMIEGKYYTISITSVGSGDYKDSDISYVDFVYEKPDMIEINVDDYIGKDEKLLKAKLDQLGIKYKKVISEESICDDQQIVLDITGLQEKKYDKSSINELDVKYTCCKVE